MPNQRYLIRYAEIALKGKNRKWFEQKLINNIKQKLNNATIRQLHSQIILETTDAESKTMDILQHTFGIAWFTKIETAPLNIKDITTLSVKTVSQIIKPTTKTFAVRATRHNKKYNLTSREIEIEVGSKIATSHKLNVDLSNPDLTLYIEILDNNSLIYTTKTQGPGGLPVGTAGKALSLLSGGFDSIASSYLMAKRGMMIDFIHFHVFADPDYLKQTKIWNIYKHLSPIVHAKTLYPMSYTKFQIAMLNLDRKHQPQELILFRRYMFRKAIQLAQQHGYQAIISGDSLGQVASQTLSNLSAVDEAISSMQQNTQQHIPLFRPLIGMDKIEIIDLVKKIGIYDEAIKPYKDCCSLVSKHPATTANIETIKKIEKNIQIDL